jgi:hypothetical protein
VVEEISRAGDSEFLAQFLRDSEKRRPDQRVVVALSKNEANLDIKSLVNTEFSQQEAEDLAYLREEKRRVEARRKRLEATPNPNWQESTLCDRKLSFIGLEEREIIAQERGRRICRKLALRHTGVRKFLAISAVDYPKAVDGYRLRD